MNRTKTASGLIVFALLMVVNVPAPQKKTAPAQNTTIEKPSTSALCIPAQPISCRPSTINPGLAEAGR
jgi:hypothetical protein